MSYSAGNLELELLSSINDSTIQALNNINTSLSSLSTTLSSITSKDLKWLSSFGTNITTLSKKLNEIDWATQSNGLLSFANSLSPLSGILNSFSADNLKNISSLGTRFSTLGKKLTNIDWVTVKKGFDSLTTAITPFVNKISRAENGLRELNQTLTKVNNKKLKNINDFAKNTNSGGFNFKRLFNVGVAISFGRAVYRIVQYGSNFTETLNLWQVAMRGNLEQADEFIKKMNRAYSISQTTLMNAQATFKNMIGSLGNVSDDVSYQLSESILQMALDFSSLYNVTFENAIQKFQAALAGQVRPVRSVSGYDITENTLQQIYESLGGTKSQRQLNRTEKQLLAIYAVFKQMEASGAVGDLTKTLDTFANQSRMVSENYKELLTYTGLFLQNLLQSWGVLKYINAGLIFLTEIMKALTNYEAPDFLDNMFEMTDATNKAVDELQGKLLDFDKIRALNSSSGTDIGIDETLINALKNYKSVLDGVNNEARNLAENWLDKLGLTDDKLNSIKNVVTAIGITAGVILGVKFILSIRKILTSLNLLDTSLSGISLLLLVTVGSFAIAIEAFKNGERSISLLAGSIGVLSGALLVYIGLKKIEQLVNSGVLNSNLALFLAYNKVRIAAAGLALGGIALLNSNLNALIGNWDKLSTFQKVVGIFGAIGAAALAAAAAVAAFHGAWTMGTAAVAIVGGLAAIAGAFATFKRNTDSYNYSMPNIGSVDIGGIDNAVLSTSNSTPYFTAYSGSGTQTSWTSASQLKSAVYQALVEYGKNHPEDTAIVLNLDGEVAYKTVVRHALMRGEFLSKR